MSDAIPLNAFVTERSEDAFRQLLEQHTDLVYSTCLRGLHGDRQAAEDATQAVFVILARKAASIRRPEALGGWLFQTARSVVASQQRQEARRRQREEKAMTARREEETREVSGDPWDEIRPLLNQALAALAPAQQEAVILHFLQGKTQREVAEVLGITENAARKRIHTGLEALRRRFARQGVVVAAMILGASLSSQAVHAAPAGLSSVCHATAWASLTASAGAAASAPVVLAQGAMHMMLWTQVKMTAVAVVAVLALTAGAATAIQALAPAPAPQSPDRIPPVAATPAPVPAPGDQDAAAALQLSLQVTPTLWNPGGALQLACTVRNVSDKPIRIPAWGLMDFSDALELLDEKGTVIAWDSDRIRNGSRVLMDSDFLQIPPHGELSFQLIGRVSQEAVLYVNDRQGGAWHWPKQTGLAPGLYTLRALIRTEGREETYGRAEKTRGKLWRGTVKSDGVEVRVLDATTAARLKALQDNLDRFSFYLSYFGEEEKPFYRLLLQVPPLALSKMPSLYAQAQLQPDEARALIDHLARIGELTSATDCTGQAVKDRAPRPGYTLTMRAGFHICEHPLGWDLAMIRRLDAIRAVLHGDAARAMDTLLGRLTGLRAAWGGTRATPPAPGDEKDRDTF